MLKNQVELSIGNRIKVLQSDGDGEFDALNHFLASLSITKQISCHYISQ